MFFDYLSFNTLIINVSFKDNDVSQLKQKYTQLYDDFKQNELIAIVCAKLADIILKNPESWDANLINLISIVSFKNDNYYFDNLLYNIFTNF